MIPKLPKTLHYIYDPDSFPQNFINIPKLPSETIQKFSIDHHKIEIKNCNAELQPFTCTNVPENTNTSLEESSIENMDIIFHSQQKDTRINETTETDFNSTLLDDGAHFPSHTVNTLIDLESNDQNNNYNTNKNFTNDTTNNTHIYQNTQNIQPIKSTELTEFQIR